nr:MAG TPA: hypothetical protein [Caudoviricetes sp.]
MLKYFSKSSLLIISSSISSSFTTFILPLLSIWCINIVN